jgi:glycerol uptake facilitator-like aquaporin
MINEYIAEAVGSFIFFTIILTKEDATMIAVALLIGILIASVASQGHLNPAVTAMAYMKGSMNGEKSVAYIVSQLIGAFAAVQWSKYIGGTAQAETYKLFSSK